MTAREAAFDYLRYAIRGGASLETAKGVTGGRVVDVYLVEQAGKRITVSRLGHKRRDVERFDLVTIWTQLEAAQGKGPARQLGLL